MKNVSIFAVALLLAGCAAKTTTTGTSPPPPPQVGLSNALNALASADDATVHSIIAARNNGTVSPADASAVEAACGAVAKAGKQMDAELNSSDVWCTSNITATGCQQGKLLQILQSAGLAQLNAHISQNAQLLVASLLTAANAVSAALGGPVL